MEFIFEVLLEVILQLFFEILVQLGLHKAVIARRSNPLIAAWGYFFLGTILGLLSLVFFSDSLISNKTVRVVNLGATPVAVGIIMAMTGRSKRKRGMEVIRIEQFFFGYLFALGFAIVRYTLTA